MDKRFQEFLNEMLNGKDHKIVLVIHGMILMYYLQTMCNFNFNGNTFNITFNNKEVINRRFNIPDVFKIDYDDNNQVIDITNIEI